MKYNRKYFYLPLFFSLVACSDIPSESDIEDSLANIYSECEQINIIDVEKTNGLDLENGYYSVSTVFSLELEPLKENTELWEKFSHDLEIYPQIQEKQNQEYSDFLKRFNDPKNSNYQNYQKFSNNLDSEEYKTAQQRIKENKRLLNAEQKEMIKRHADELKEQGLTNFDNSGYKLTRKQISNLDKVCSATKSKLGGKLLREMLGIKFMGGQTRKEKARVLGEGTIIEFNAELEMIRTENGWQLNDI